MPLIDCESLTKTRLVEVVAMRNTVLSEAVGSCLRIQSSHGLQALIVLPGPGSIPRVLSDARETAGGHGISERLFRGL